MVTWRVETLCPIAIFSSGQLLLLKSLFSRSRTFWNLCSIRIIFQVYFNISLLIGFLYLTLSAKKGAQERLDNWNSSHYAKTPWYMRNVTGRLSKARKEWETDIYLILRRRNGVNCLKREKNVETKARLELVNWVKTFWLNLNFTQVGMLSWQWWRRWFTRKKDETMRQLYCLCLGTVIITIIIKFLAPTQLLWEMCFTEAKNKFRDFPQFLFCPDDYQGTTLKHKFMVANDASQGKTNLPRLFVLK